MLTTRFFDGHRTFRDNLSQGRFSNLSAIFDRDHLHGDATRLVTFLDNHDIGPQNDWKYRFDGKDEALASALELHWTVRGIPCLFYGTEIRFKAGAEIDGSDALHDSSGRAYFGDHLEPRAINSTRNHPIAQIIKRLNEIGRASEALQKGVMESYGGTDQHCWFARNHEDGAAYAVVGLSQSGGTITVNGVKEGTYRNAVTGNELTASDGGSLTFDMKPSSACIYILNGPGKIEEDGQFLR